MISLFRDFTKTWIFKGLMVLLVLSFAVFGLNNVFSANTGSHVLTAGDREVTPQEFKMRFDNVRKNAEEQGQTVNAEEFVETKQHEMMLSQLGNQLAFSAWLDRLGVKPSNQLLLQEIGKIPAFFNNVTGRFDHDTYTQTLNNAGVTVEAFESERRDEIAVNQYSSAALAGLQAPRIFAAADAAFSLQGRDASLFMLSPMNVTQPAAPTEADIKAYYDDNKARFTLPELRTATVVLFSAQDYAKEVTVSDDELRKAFEARRASLSKPETRSFVQISAPDMAAAGRISAALKSGQTPEAAAKAHKGEVITYTAKPKSAVPDAKIADAAFALQRGEVSAAVQGNLGAAVIKLDDIQIGSAPDFAAMRGQLDEDLRKEKASARLNEVTNAFSDALNKGESFEAAAQRLGLRMSALEPMTAEGQTANPQASYAAYKPLVNGIYALPQVGSASDVESLGGEGQYFAVKLTGLKPAGPMPFAEIRDQLGAMWMQEKMQANLEAEATKAVERLNKGESIDAVAASYKTQVRPLKGVTRQTAQQMQLPQAIMARIFTGKPGETFHADTPMQGVPAVAIGRLDSVHQGEAALANSRTAMVTSQVTRMVSGDIVSLTQSGAQDAVKVKTNPNLAARALGVEPPKDAAKDAPAKDEKGKS